MNKENMTVDQRAAVEDRGGALLVSAAAGSGKTMVLVGRLMEYLCDPNDPKNINDFLIITYTKAAAAELRMKISAELSSRLASQPDSAHLRRQLNLVYLAQISTVHSFCSAILREYAWKAELTPDFRVAEERDCTQWKQAVLDDLLEARYAEMTPAFASLADTLGAGRDDRALSQLVLNVYNAMQTHVDPEDWLTRTADQLAAADQPENTPWGAFLLEELARKLTEWKTVVESLANQAAMDEPLAKGYLPSLEQTLAGLDSLIEAARTGWDAVSSHPLCREPGGLFPTARAGKGCDPALKNRIQTARDVCKTTVKGLLEVFTVPGSQAMAEVGLTVPAVKELLETARDFAQAYSREKARRNALDFSDLEHLALKLLRDGNGAATPAAREIARRFTEVLVDEYQDTNAVQDAIFTAVSRAGQNLFLVGDVKQSIYSFRLADPTLFLQRYQDYAPAAQAAAGQPRKILLSQNFRSRREVLEAANWVFAATMSPQVGGLEYGPAEQLVPGAAYPEGDYTTELHVIQADALGGEDEQNPGKTKTEAAFVARRIRQLLDAGFPVTDGDHQRPVEPRDIVILLRSPSNAAGTYLAALDALGIPGTSEKGGSLLSEVPVQLLLALLRVVDNPRQDIPLAGILASPVFGFTADELAQVRLADPAGCFYDALVAYAPQSEKAQSFLAVLDGLRRQAATTPVSQLVWEALRQTRMIAILTARPDGARAESDLTAIFHLACQFTDGGSVGLAAFLDWLEAQSDTLKPAADTVNAVSLVSIHKSKGLEYPVVILADLAHGFNETDLSGPLLLHSRLGAGARAVDLELGQTWPTVAHRAISARGKAELLSEELRILYVAMTRAKEKLIMVYCHRYAKNHLKKLTALTGLPVSPAASAQASCLGSWVLLAALARPEAGALWEAAELEPAEVWPVERPWQITWHSGRELLNEARYLPARAPAAERTETAPDPAELLAALTFRYPHPGAVAAPTKLTATQLKGRLEDQEAAENTVTAWPVTFDPPRFRTGGLTPQERGTAVHLAMQYAEFDALTTPEGAAQELRRLVAEGYLSAQQGAAVEPALLSGFRASPLGQRVAAAPEVVREFKFSLLVDAGAYLPEAAGEQVLLQGMVDCCLLEPDGLVILDFKTDRLAPGQEAERGEHYRPQLTAYADALSRVFEKPVKQTVLYFFSTGAVVTL